MNKIERCWIVTIGTILWLVCGDTNFYEKAASKLNSRYITLLLTSC